MRVLIGIFILALSIQSFADVLEQIPGRTQTEREIRWLWKYLPDVVRACAKSGSECQSSEINKVVLQLIPTYPATIEKTDSSWGQILQFVSEKSRPDIFTTGADEEHRIAVTGLTKDSPIFINTDRMELPISKWIGILAHESVHHLGYKDDETRLPDRVGAAIESKFLRISSLSTLEEFGQPQVRILIANTNRTDSNAPTMVSLPMFGNDQYIGPNSRVPICQNNQRFKGQNVGSALWRTLRVRPKQGLVKVKASAIVRSTCEDIKNKEQSHPQTVFLTELDLQFAPFDIQSDWWTHPSKILYETSIAGNDDEDHERIELDGTMAISSILHEQSVVNAGEIWKSKIKVESLDAFVPKSCSADLTGLNWSFHDIFGVPAVEHFDSCTIKSLGNNQYQVDLQTLIPKNAQPDFFYFTWIAFSDDLNVRYAVPSRPKAIEVRNSAASAPLKIIDWRVLGLQPVDKIMGRAIEKSFRAKRDQNFWVEVDVMGSAKIGKEYMEFDALAVDPTGSVVLAPTTLEVQTNTLYVQSFERLAIPGGVRLRYQMRIPTSGKLEVHGIKFLKFYSKTDDFSWVEFDITKVLSGFILDESVQ